MLTGPNTGLRRQILSVNSTTQITLALAFPSTTLGSNYRIDTSLETFGGATNDLVSTQLLPDLVGEVNLLSSSIVTPINNFFNAVFTDVATGTDGVTNASTFTSAASTFLTDEVGLSDLLFIRSGTSAGFYKISSVTQTNLGIEGTFPSNLTGVTFRVVRSLGLTVDPLNGVLAAALTAETFLTATQAFRVVFVTPIPVAGDAAAFAMRLYKTDLDTRETAVSNRVSNLPNDVTGIENELSAGDRLYDKRYVWIDARINLEKGILVMKDRAVANRIKARADVLKQLTKLLSVQQA
jgi:hypothetical protein